MVSLSWWCEGEGAADGRKRRGEPCAELCGGGARGARSEVERGRRRGCRATDLCVRRQRGLFGGEDGAARREEVDALVRLGPRPATHLHRTLEHIEGELDEARELAHDVDEARPTPVDLAVVPDARVGVVERLRDRVVRVVRLDVRNPNLLIKKNLK